jgi:hypothetical protein
MKGRVRPSPRKTLQELELPKPLRTLGAWVWAAGTVASRTVFVPFDKAGALCPFGDLFNYAPPPPPADPEVEDGPLLHALDAERWRDALGADTCPEASLSTAAAAEDMEEEDMLVRLQRVGFGVCNRVTGLITFLSHRTP